MKLNKTILKIITLCHLSESFKINVNDIDEHILSRKDIKQLPNHIKSLQLTQKQSNTNSNFDDEPLEILSGLEERLGNLVWVVRNFLLMNFCNDI